MFSFRTSFVPRTPRPARLLAILLGVGLLKAAVLPHPVQAQSNGGAQSTTVSLASRVAPTENVKSPAKTAGCESCGIKLQLAAWDDAKDDAAIRSVAAQTATDPLANNARKLAKQLLHSDEPAADVIARILRKAGFGIKRPDGTIIAQPDGINSQNIAFDPWEVKGMTLMARDGIRVPLSDISLLLSTSLSEPQSDSFNSLLLDGIRKNAQSANSGLRFWALFIVEMGRQSEEPYDLLKEVEVSKVQLSPIQVAFIVRRLEVDLYAKSQSIEISRGDIDGVRGRIVPVLSPFPSRSMAAAPCTFTKTEQTIMDVNGKVASKGFRKLISLISAGAAKLASAANKALSFAKVIMTYAALKANIKLENSPLVRTKNRTPGEQRTITATFTVSFPQNTQWVNCARFVLNGVGLDYSQPNQGTPADGASVNWVAIAGFPAPVTFKGDPLNHVTDSQGMTTVEIIGAAQKQKLPDNATPVQKTATVRAVVNLQAANIFKDFTSAGGTIISPFRMPGELLKKMWPYSLTYTFPVKDWEVRYKFKDLKTKWNVEAFFLDKWNHIDTLTWSVSGNLCTGQPFADPWLMDFSQNGSYASSSIPDVPVHLSETGTVSLPESRLFHLEPTNGFLSVTFRPGPPATLTLKITPASGAPNVRYIPSSQTVTVPVELMKPDEPCP